LRQAAPPVALGSFGVTEPACSNALSPLPRPCQRQPFDQALARPVLSRTRTMFAAGTVGIFSISYAVGALLVALELARPEKASQSPAGSPSF